MFASKVIISFASIGLFINVFCRWFLPLATLKNLHNYRFEFLFFPWNAMIIVSNFQKFCWWWFMSISKQQFVSNLWFFPSVKVSVESFRSRSTTNCLEVLKNDLSWYPTSRFSGSPTQIAFINFSVDSFLSLNDFGLKRFDLNPAPGFGLDEKVITLLFCEFPALYKSYSINPIFNFFTEVASEKIIFLQMIFLNFYRSSTCIIFRIICKIQNVLVMKLHL